MDNSWEKFCYDAEMEIGHYIPGGCGIEECIYFFNGRNLSMFKNFGNGLFEGGG